VEERLASRGGAYDAGGRSSLRANCGPQSRLGNDAGAGDGFGGGEPASVREIGGETAVSYDSVQLGGLCCTFQTESQSYLERDRSIPSEIIPSDKFSGLEIAFGHLKLYTQWTAQGTTILHALTGENHRITHQIEWRPAAARADHR